jgi:hypothetical protein
LSRKQFVKLHSACAVKRRPRLQPQLINRSETRFGGSDGRKKENPMNAHIYEQITERIITLLTQGTIPWQKSVNSLLARLQEFFSQEPLRNMVSQRVNKLDFADIMDSGKIFLAKLSTGLGGEENSYLLGTLLIAKFQQLAMARQAQKIETRRDFWLYIDEFQHFISPSMEKILTGARKYRLGFTLREQHQGRGGPEHKAIQKQIKAEAQKLGFISKIEESILEGRASVDVWLERDGLTIACEISFTNTEDNESEKIIRCLKAGIPKFAVICADEKKLQKIAATISGNIDEELSARVEYYQLNQFIERLKSLPKEPPKKSERIRRGYKIKHSQSSGSTAEQKIKEEAAIRAIAEAVQQKKKP